MSDYDTIMESIMSGDLKALQEFSEIVDDFPTGCDHFIERHWITNAIDCGTFEVIEWMVDQKVSLHFRDDEGYTVLHSALERDKADKQKVLRLLIQAGADINAKGINDYTPAHKAAAWGDLDSLRLLVDSGADLTIRTEIDEYETPLGETVAMNAPLEVIKYLRKRGGGADQPPTALESKPEDNSNPKPESEGRPQ